MQINTTTGYSTMVIYNNVERSLYIFFVYYGDALISIALGMMANNFQAFPQKKEEILVESQ